MKRLLLASGSACLLVGALPLVSSAAVEPGSGLGGFSMSAKAPAVQVRQEEPSYCYGTASAKNGCELVLPEATSSLRRGPIGNALAAVVWPGALVADIGNLLITASDGQVPDDARMLNDPVRAEAQTSTGADTVTYDQVPGTTMKAVAKDDLTSAEAAVGQVTNAPVGTFGRVEGVTSTSLQGASLAVATAASSVQDVDLAGGVVHIGAVRSSVRVTSDGKAATATGSTQVTGMTIAGVPVTVDGEGLHVMGTGLGAGAALEAVNTAVAQLGLVVAMGAPDGTPQGGAVSYRAGSLVVLWEQTDGYRATVTLGGTSATVDADPPLPTGVAPLPSSPEAPSGPSSSGSSGSSGEVPVGGVSSPGLSGDPGVTAPGLAPTVPTASGSAPVLAGRVVPLPEGLSPWLGAVGVLGAGLVMAGLRRLPDRLLEARAPECLREESR